MKKYFNPSISLLLLSMMSLTSCATIVNGTKQKIGISSQPSHAAVWVDNYYMGETPVIVQMTRKDNHFVRIELEGYLPFEAMFTRDVSGWAFGNIIFGGFIGIAVDVITGGIYKLSPEQVQAQMYPNQCGYAKGKSKDSYIGFVLQPDPAWEKIGNMQANQG